MLHALKIYLVFVGILLTAASVWAQDSAGSPYRLTLEDAIHRGLQANLGVLVAETRTQEAEAAAERKPVAAAAAGADPNPGYGAEPQSGGDGNQHSRACLCRKWWDRSAPMTPEPMRISRW